MIMPTTIQIPPRPAVEYPDSDGKPMSDNTLQYKWIVTIKEGVDALSGEGENVFVAGDLLWYPVEGNNRIRTGPDVLVAFGRPRGYRGSYKQWQEGSVVPQVIFEVLSPGNRPGKMKRKFQFYQKYGVEEYYIYNPDNGALQGWLRCGAILEKLPEMAGFVSARLGIRFEPGEGPDNLRIIRPDGEPFLGYREVLDQRNAAVQLLDIARQRADIAEQRADNAEQRADSERQRAEQFAARLRELGIEPE
jgi:Uma2 family endonuclease